MIAHFTKEDLIARLGEPAEENVRPHATEPGKPLNVLRWNCGCGATSSEHELLWDWDPGDCRRHASGLSER